MPRLLYQIVGDIEYRDSVEKILEEVKKDFCFDEIIISENKRISEDLDFYYNQLSSLFKNGECEKYGRRIVKSVEEEIKNIGDRKVVFYYLPDRRFLELKELEEKYFVEWLLSEAIPLETTNSLPKSKKEIEIEIKKMMDEILQLHERVKQKYLKEFLSYREYTREEICGKIKSLPVFLSIPVKTLPFISKNEEISKYYDWSYAPCTVCFIPGDSNRFSIQTLLPTMRHEFNHTFNSLTTRTEEGRELLSLLFPKQASLNSCADVVNCVGIDLAFYMEGWYELGRHCKFSIEDYQREIGDLSVRRIRGILKSF
ncbi:MAG: hypothetical protein QW040_03875 [Candidatus Aenigmatarchaeota archaeon]